VIPLIILLALGGLMHAARSFSEISIAGTELAFGFLLLTAYFTAKIFSRFGLPKLTGYIAAGVVSGPFVLGLVTKDMTASLKIVSSTATAIIALEAGAELDLKKVRSVVKELRAITLWAVIGAMFTITAVLFALRSRLPFLDGMTVAQSLAVCMVIGVALSAQSPAVMMAMLSETRAQGPLSQLMLASVVVADLTVIVMFSLASAITGAVIGGGVDLASTAGAVIWELFGSIAFGVAIGLVIGQFLISVKQGASLFALLICVVVAEIGSRVHLDPLIVMLAAGVWLNNFSRADAGDLMHGFASAQLPVFLVFFALAGSKLDIRALWSSLLIVLAVAGTRASTFYLGAKMALRQPGIPDVVRQHAWVGLLPQAGLALALALVLQKNFPSFGNQAAVILFGVVGFNEVVAPVILRTVLLKSGEAGKKSEADFATSAHGRRAASSDGGH
jgi:Kef-type K+ transport system membrane component KefB